MLLLAACVHHVGGRMSNHIILCTRQRKFVFEQGGVSIIYYGKVVYVLV